MIIKFCKSLFKTSNQEQENEDYLNDIIEKSRLLALKTHKMIKESFVWNFRSKLSGEWLDYKESSHYQTWDSVRKIDWRNTAKNWKLFVKRFEQSKQLKIVLIVDTSNTMLNWINHHKKDKLMEALALIVFSCSLSWDTCWLYILWEWEFIPFSKWKSHSMRLIQRVLKEKFNKKNVDYKTDFSNLSSIIKWKTVCFLLSDFINIQLINNLKYLDYKHERIWVIFRDDICKIKENSWFSEIKNPETWEYAHINWNKLEKFKKELDIDYKTKKASLQKNWIKNFEVFESDDLIEPFMKFFS